MLNQQQEDNRPFQPGDSIKLYINGWTVDLDVESSILGIASIQRQNETGATERTVLGPIHLPRLHEVSIHQYIEENYLGIKEQVEHAMSELTIFPLDDEDGDDHYLKLISEDRTLHIMQKPCAHCLFGPNRLVDLERKRTIVNDCVTLGTSFLCHLPLAEPDSKLPQNIICAGFESAFPNHNVATRLAKHLNLVRYHNPDGPDAKVADKLSPASDAQSQRHPRLFRQLADLERKLNEHAHSTDLPIGERPESWWQERSGIISEIAGVRYKLQKFSIKEE